MHPRQAIREAVVAQLKGSPGAWRTAAQDRVYGTRRVPWTQVQLPAISVYTPSESVDPDSKNSAPRCLYRYPKLVIEGAARTTGNIDNVLDDLALQIEKAMERDVELAGTCNNSILSSTEIEADVTGEQPIGAVIMTYWCELFTDSPDEDDVTLDDLSTVDAKTSLGGEQAPADQTEVMVTGLDT